MERAARPFDPGRPHTPRVVRPAIVLATLLAATAARGAEPPAIRTTPERLVNGSAFLVHVTPTARWKSVSGTFEGRRVLFDPEPSTGGWVGFAGLGYEAAAGRHELLLHVVPEEGAPADVPIGIPVERAARPKSQLRVPKRFLEPDARTRARIKREQAIKAELLTGVTPRWLATGPFSAPVRNETSEGYGVERLFNGQRQSVHQGLDYRAPSGTPVAAIGAGRVALARDFFYEGRCVAIDHGHGLLTLYLHFSRLDVTEGQEVTAGQRLGLSGSTGRVTGPHLHLAVRWQGLYLDPASLLALALP